MEEKRQAQLGGEVDGGMWNCLYMHRRREEVHWEGHFICYDKTLQIAGGL